MTQDQRAEWKEHQDRLYAMAVDDGETWDLSDNDQAACNAGGDAIMTLLDNDQEARRDWQPIETAPKDGMEVLLGWFELPGMKMQRVGRWHPRENAWIDTHRALHNQHAFPTHWMPLPEPPQ